MGDDRPVDGQHALETLGGAGEIVCRRHDRTPATSLGLQDVHQVLLGRGIDAGDRLVEQVEIGLPDQGASEEHAASLTAR